MNKDSEVLLAESKRGLKGNKRGRKLIMEHHNFWNLLEFEVGFVEKFQKLIHAKETMKFWYYTAMLAGSRMLSFYPSIFYVLGYYETAKMLSKALIFYALFSSFGKFTIKRRRPGSYPNVYTDCCSTTSSFPSRHITGSTVIANFIPFKWPFLIFMTINRMALGQHYLSDCLVGYIIGESAVYVSKQFDDLNLILGISIMTLYLWSGASNIVAGTIPILVAKNVKIAPILFPLLFLKKIIKLILANKEKKDKFQLLIERTLENTLPIFIIVIINSDLLRMREKGTIKTDFIWTFLEDLKKSIFSK